MPVYMVYPTKGVGMDTPTAVESLETKRIFLEKLILKLKEFKTIIMNTFLSQTMLLVLYQ